MDGPIARCREHGLVADAQGLCAVCRHKARVAVSWRTWIALSVFAVLGLTAAVAVAHWREGLARDRALLEARGPAIAIHPWFEVPVYVSDTRVVRNREPNVANQGTRRFLFPTAEADPTATPQPLAAASETAPATASAQPAKGARETRTEETKPRQAATEPVVVKMYMADWCGACKDAKKWLQARRIPFEELNIDSSEAVAEQLRRVNPKKSIPTFDIEGTIVVGFGASSLESTLRKATEAKALRGQ